MCKNQHFRSTELSANKLLARHPNGVDLEDVFRQIQTECSDLSHLRLPLMWSLDDLIITCRSGWTQGLSTSSPQFNPDERVFHLTNAISSSSLIWMAALSRF